MQQDDPEFPITLHWADGTSQAYASRSELSCNLEEWDAADEAEGARITDSRGRRLVVVIQLTSIVELRLRQALDSSSPPAAGEGA